MSKPTFKAAVEREYHDGMLVMTVRPSVRAASPTSAVMAALTEGVSRSPGLSSLHALERAGMIKRITPLQETPEPRRVPGMAPMMSRVLAAFDRPRAAAAPETEGQAMVVELERDGDVNRVSAELAADPHIESVSRVPIRYLLAARKKGRRKGRGKVRGTTPAAAAPPVSSMWNLAKIEWERARAAAGFRDAKSVKVAVLDTGIDEDHPDLKGLVKGYEYEFEGVDAPSSKSDIIGHGTHVSGTIAAKVNDFGVNGICTCALHSWKIFDDQTDYVPEFDAFVYFVHPIMYRRALMACIEKKIDVVNLSIGGPGRPDAQERQLFADLLEAGTTIVAAMGNERRDGSPTSYPAAIPGVIAVGATSINDTVANFSNRGPHISLGAPGVSIWSTLPTYPGQSGFEADHEPGRPVSEGKPDRRETDYDAWNGTSMASPHVAAAAALLLAKKGAMTPSDVREALMESADKVAAMNGDDFHPDYGAGRLNLRKLLA